MKKTAVPGLGQEIDFDTLKFAMEAQSGGKNTILLDDNGMPSIMVRIPKFRICDVIANGSAEVHPAFIVNGKEIDEFFVSKFTNVVINHRAYSLPMQDPAVHASFDLAKEYCVDKGSGWHLTSLAESAAIALWCKRNGTMPRGNDNYGASTTHPWEKGGVAYSYEKKGRPSVRTYSGTGPASWAHDGTNEGIFDLAGNLSEWSSGLRLVNGEIQIIPDNDVAAGANEAADSADWRAILPDGSLVTPGTPGTLKYDYLDGPPALGGNIILTDELEHRQMDKEIYAYQPFEQLHVKSGLQVPEIVKALALFPADTESHGGDYIYVRNLGERFSVRGGNWYSGARSGVFALSLHGDRFDATDYRGFRSSYIAP